jgi:hypothetical protein
MSLLPALLALFLLFPSPVLSAMKLTIESYPTGVGQEEFTVDSKLIDAPSSETYWLQCVFTEIGKTNYFGYTKNNSGLWYNGSDHLQYFQINTSPEGTWSGQLKAKVDTENSAYKGIGDYTFKIGRWTKGGNRSWSDNEVTIAINIAPTSTPTPTPTSTPTSGPTDTPVPTSTNTPTSTPPPTQTPTSTPTPTRSPSPTNPPPETQKPEVLGISDYTTPAPSSSASSSPAPPALLAYLSVFLGSSFFFAGAILPKIQSALLSKKPSTMGEDDKI